MDNTPEYKLLFQGSRLDRWHLRALRPFLRAGGTFVDIGANFGFFSLNAATAMGDRGRILAIEPNCVMVSRLRENIRFNGIKSIVIRDVAVGEARGSAASFSDGRDHGGAGYGIVDAERIVDRPVSMIPLLDVIREVGLEKIDVLKIDIEGFEDRALAPFFRAAPKSLWPRVIAIEDSHRDRWELDLIDRLIGLGYRIMARGCDDHVLIRNTV